MNHSDRPDGKEEMISSRTESRPNGKVYGINGHIPCDHVAVFEYPSYTREYDGTNWRVTRVKEQ